MPWEHRVPLLVQERPRLPGADWRQLRQRRLRVRRSACGRHVARRRQAAQPLGVVQRCLHRSALALARFPLDLGHQRGHAHLLEGAPPERPLLQLRADCGRVIVRGTPGLAKALAQLGGLVRQAVGAASQALQRGLGEIFGCINGRLHVLHLPPALRHGLLLSLCLQPQLAVRLLHGLSHVAGEPCHPGLRTLLCRQRGLPHRGLDLLRKLRPDICDTGIQQGGALVEPLLELLDDVSLEDLLAEAGSGLHRILV
mmetsp:Transcript_53017/g.151021  ORF Transcript_53017/g.151021 Transcript_53017/m.151021 type:complete len:255 (-) Transcript_53017:743-1507(-)